MGWPSGVHVHAWNVFGGVRGTSTPKQGPHMGGCDWVWDKSMCGATYAKARPQGELGSRAHPQIRIPCIQIPLF